MKGEIPIAVLSRYFRVPSRQVIAADYPGRDVLLKSRVTNISNNGVFISTPNPMPTCATAWSPTERWTRRRISNG